MLNRSFLSLTLTLFSCFINQLAMANNNEPLDNIWQVSLVEGLTQIKSVEDVTKGNDWKDLSLGENISGQSYIRTGADSRIILKHRKDTLTWPLVHY